MLAVEHHAWHVVNVSNTNAVETDFQVLRSNLNGRSAEKDSAHYPAGRGIIPSRPRQPRAQIEGN